MASPVFESDVEILVVMTCFRAADLTIDCLETLEPEVSERQDVRVMVCENGSGPESVERLEAAIREHGWGGWVTLRPVHPNRGFTGGNNVILREAMAWPRPPRHFLLLNTDTLVRPGAVAALLDGAERHPEAGVIGTRLEWPDGEVQISAFRFKSPVSELIDAAATGPVTALLRRWNVPVPAGETPRQVDWVSFACALVRREVVEAIGLLDESYYLYFDDVDYCRRAREAGFGVLYWPASRVVHLRGRSNPVKRLTIERKRRPPYYYASRTRYFARYYGRLGLLVANLLWGVGRLVALLRETLGNKRPHVCEREWRDVWLNFADPLQPPSEEMKQGREVRPRALKVPE